ncbi:hypothetical protein WSM22_38200 [Cytophagales bacterium WSM2-2]|nr:hypothetical protein WSM22_38200 [Cytophagales bacterium WSM2-2]
MCLIGCVNNDQLNHGIVENIINIADGDDLGITLPDFLLAPLNYFPELKAGVRSKKGSMKDFARHTVGKQCRDDGK